MSKFEKDVEEFNTFLKEHEDWFNKNVPVNPIISKDDEWYDEDECEGGQHNTDKAKKTSDFFGCLDGRLDGMEFQRKVRDE